tara:strand:+ start:141 stop:284 length:144 start_codon:yes stop_codon:yes gene_type:complete
MGFIQKLAKRSNRVKVRNNKSDINIKYIKVKDKRPALIYYLNPKNWF